MEAPAGGDPDDDQGRAGRGVPRDRRRRPGALRPRPVRRLPRHRRRRAGLDDRDLRRAAARHRQLALVRACRSSSAPASCCPVTQTELRLVFKKPPRLGFRLRDADAGANQLVVQARSVDGHQVRSSKRSEPTACTPRRSTSTCVFSEEGGEGATPYEVLLARGDGRPEHALHAPGRRGGDLADHAAAARRAAAGPAVRAGSWGPPRPPTSSSPATAAGTSRGSTSMSDTTTAPERARQSAAAPVAVPADRRLRVPLRLPHRRARRARRRDRLALRAAFDSPSVFGSLLDRQAGFFRFGPFGINHPTARHYEPGTNVLVTTWKTPSGWVVVRDALTMGPRDHEDTITPHTRPPADDDAEHTARAHGRVPRGSRRDGARLRARVRLRPGAGGVDARRRRPSHRRRHGAGVTIRLQTDLALGIEGGRVRGRHVLEAGDRAYCALVVGRGARQSRRTPTMPRSRIATTVRFWRSWLGRARIPDHRWRDPIQRSALAIKGLTYMPTGATVAALTTSLPETPGGERNWDYRYTWMRDTTFTLQALHWLNLDWEADEFMQFVADVEPTEDGSLQIMYGIDGRRDLTETTLRRALRLRRRPPGADRQRRVRPAPERRLRRGARLDPPPHATEPSACRARSGRSCRTDATAEPKKSWKGESPIGHAGPEHRADHGDADRPARRTA